MLSLVLGNLLFAIWEKRHPLTRQSAGKIPIDKIYQKQLMKLVFFVIFLITSCLLIENVTNWSMIVIVCLVSIIIPLLFGILSKRWKELIPRLVDFRDRTVLLLNNEIMLFMSAGMLAFALKGTAAANEMA